MDGEIAGRSGVGLGYGITGSITSRLNEVGTKIFGPFAGVVEII
jgi:hypothetical protein